MSLRAWSTIHRDKKRCIQMLVEERRPDRLEEPDLEKGQGLGDWQEEEEDKRAPHNWTHRGLPRYPIYIPIRRRNCSPCIQQVSMDMSDRILARVRCLPDFCNEHSMQFELQEFQEIVPKIQEEVCLHIVRSTSATRRGLA